MTDEPLHDVHIRNSSEFHSVITTAIEKALKNGVDVRGAWQVQTNGSIHDWEVEIFELAKDHGQ